MDCLLFRHGIAVEREDWNGQEAERPLTRKGADKTREAAVGLRRLDVAPTHVLSSPLTRALETAKLVGEVFRLTDVKVCDELLPDAPPDKLFPLLASLPNDACAICVGHEPHLGLAAGLMLLGHSATALSLKKAGACCIRFEDGPKAGKGTLRWWMTPDQLRKLKKT